MDALKAEIASKRKALQDDPAASARPNKYMRRGDIEKLKEEQELKERQEKEQKENEERERFAEAAAAKRAAKMKVCLWWYTVICQVELNMDWRIGPFAVCHRLACPFY